MKISYCTLKRWLDPEPAKPVQFVEFAGEHKADGLLKAALPYGIWAEFTMNSRKSDVAS